MILKTGLSFGRIIEDWKKYKEFCKCFVLRSFSTECDNMELGISSKEKEL